MKLSFLQADVELPGAVVRRCLSRHRAQLEQKRPLSTLTGEQAYRSSDHFSTQPVGNRLKQQGNALAGNRGQPNRPAFTLAIAGDPRLTIQLIDLIVHPYLRNALGVQLLEDGVYLPYPLPSIRIATKLSSIAYSIDSPSGDHCGTILGVPVWTESASAKSHEPVGRTRKPHSSV